jgi:4-amino-4-deoxy-L-arabinose transferase-like glycosyltransferase
LVGTAALVIAAHSNERRLAAAGVVCLVAALMIAPTVWSGLTNLNSSTNQTLPAAYNGGQASFGPSGQGGEGTQLTGLHINESLLSYLEANTQGAKYLMAVPSSMQGANYIIATGRPVLYLGGFSGQDQVETSDSLAQLVADGELVFVYSGGGQGGPDQSNVSVWVTEHGTAVTGFEATAQNVGAPDGMNSTETTNADGSLHAFGGGMQVTLYKLDRGG